METETNTQRLIDANLNRIKEGIRVIEDTLRYIHNDKSLSYQLKSLRHSSAIQVSFIEFRNVENDVAKLSTNTESSRENITHIVLANFKRAQESARVLEEYFKLDSIKKHLANKSCKQNLSEHFKSVRYKLYELEKEYFEKYLSY